VERPRRRRRRTAALAALALLVVVVPSAAAALEVAGVHTGFFPSGSSTESVPGEEFLDTGSPGIVAVVERLTGGVPLPAGEDWAPFMARWPSAEGGLKQRSGIGVEVEAYARCRWQVAWLDAHAAGDAWAARAAAATLQQAASWRFTVATDGGGVVAHQRRLAAAAAAGDAGPVRAAYRANCA
jgi:hypothetical protein